MATVTFTPITLTTSYQTAFSLATHGFSADMVIVTPTGGDIYAEITYVSGDIHEVAIDAGNSYPALGNGKAEGGQITLIRVKNRSVAAGTCNVGPHRN